MKIEIHFTMSHILISDATIGVGPILRTVPRFRDNQCNQDRNRNRSRGNLLIRKFLSKTKSTGRGSKSRESQTAEMDGVWS